MDNNPCSFLQQNNIISLNVFGAAKLEIIYEKSIN